MTGLIAVLPSVQHLDPFPRAMPELAEVAYYAARWNPGLGQKILRVHTGPKPRFFRLTHASAFRSLAGTTFRSARTHGKNMLFEFSRGLWLTGHLGMTGELLIAETNHAPAAHDHLVLFTSKNALIFRDFRMFGNVRLDESPDGPPPAWNALPPEIPSDAFTTAHVGNALQRHAKLPLKTFLLDQAWFPGIGNWMADEVCWQLQLHPATPAGKTDPAALRKTLRAICRTSLKTIAVDWSDPPANWLMPHRWKDGGHCPRCATALARAPLRGRTACWCPQCQPDQRSADLQSAPATPAPKAPSKKPRSLSKSKSKTNRTSPSKTSSITKSSLPGNPAPGQRKSTQARPKTKEA